MIVDYGAEDRALTLQRFYAFERRRLARERFERALKIGAAIIAVSAITIAGVLYAVGYF